VGAVRVKKEALFFVPIAKRAGNDRDLGFENPSKPPDLLGPLFGPIPIKDHWWMEVFRNGPSDKSFREEKGEAD
jgi:hypothetical protein